jgi:hypothetical protein
VTQLVEIIGPAPLDPGAEQVHVRMRDGITLATDVYLGGTSLPRPAVLIRLPYDKSGRYTFMAALAPYFNERGVHRLQRLPALPVASRHQREPVVRHQTERNEQSLVTGGSAPSWLTFTVLTPSGARTNWDRLTRA